MNIIFKSKKILFLALILSGITFGATLISTLFIYRTSIGSIKAALIDIVQSKKFLIENLNKHDLSRDSILSIIKEANTTTQIFGKTGEIVIAELINDSISLVCWNNINRNLSNFHISANSLIAEPIELAVSGKSGSIKGKDYKGVKVFAGFTYFNQFNWGIVAKIDASEVNQPFYYAIIIALILTIVFIFLGATFFIRISNPEINSIIQNEENLTTVNKELVFQNEEKEKRAAELIIANKELAFQNEEKEKRAAELIIAKLKAEESDNLKTAFLQNMSHEIRTPLNGIIGFSEMLNAKDLSKDDIKEYTTIISQCGNRLIEIVNNVLEISEIQTGQVKIDQKSVLINLIFSDLLSSFSHLAIAKNIRMNYNNQDDKFRAICTDKGKMHQILSNLLDNAIKFTKSGNIDFGYEIKDNFIQFYVRDTGIGIPPEMYDRIFDRFTQAEQSLSRNYEGAGLGLAICKGLVELLGGRIWIESEINKGTTFFFTLPYIPADLPFPEKAIHSESQIKRAKGKILIAEDDWISYQFLNRFLKKSNITMIHAENGEKAVELVRNTPDIDLILMDIRMPVMDGIEATKLIKQIRPDLPIIAQTAYAFSEEKNKILSIGCDEYLSKPIDNDKLNALINKYLKCSVIYS